MIDSEGARTGIFFGATSGVITTIGLIVGLHAGTQSLIAVIGGILVVAVADAMSDALGIHLAEEANPDASHGRVWTATITTFVTKLTVALTFAVPLIVLPLAIAVPVAVGWGLLVITLLSYYLARSQKVAVLPVVAEHVFITILVVVIAHYIGVWVQITFS